MVISNFSKEIRQQKNEIEKIQKEIKSLEEKNLLDLPTEARKLIASMEIEKMEKEIREKFEDINKLRIKRMSTKRIQKEYDKITEEINLKETESETLKKKLEKYLDIFLYKEETN